MNFNKKIEVARQIAGLSVVSMCNALDFSDTSKYERFISAGKQMSTFQIVMLYIALGSYPEACKYLAQTPENEENNPIACEC